MASRQSERLFRREDYEARVAELETEYAGREDLPRPDHWCGYRVVPHRIEFWTSVENRMHHRTIFEHTSTGWQTYLLYP